MTTTFIPHMRSFFAWPLEFKDAVIASAIAIGVSAAAVYAYTEEPERRVYMVGSLPMQSKITLDVIQSPKEKIREALGSEDRDGVAFTAIEPEISYSRTFEPMDVVIVDSHGRVSKVHEVIPGKAARLTAPPASSLVIELPKGKAKFYGLKPGAKIAERRRT